jgi:two-component system CheB/CheR fusion protein
VRQAPPDAADQLPVLPPIVGVGMSAGGLEACSQLLEALPRDPGLVFVLIQHLSPHHASALPALLGARSPLKVVEAADGMELASDTVYVIPPDYLLELEDGHLRLVPRPSEQGHVLPVDYFLKSLAGLEGDRAIAVILSGNGSDGAAGARAIKEHGGTVLVQQPDSAKYDGMPLAAMEAGAVDLVLPPGDLARKLVELAKFAGLPPNVPEGPIFNDAHYEEIFELLRSAIGVDFSHYKQPTIRRRILRRMAINRVSDIDRYVAMLREHHEEVRSLYQDILIHVTRFFREPESFQALAMTVLPQLFAAGRSDTPIRVWVAGCATGEEAYSLAIALVEFAGEDLRERQVQVFGTDISETAVEYARQGIYPANIAEVIPPERLRRFFAKVDSGYRIVKSIRDLCIFARQDLTRDPPFSKLDLVLCRNVLIYMDATLQRRVIPVFHYALKSEGFLVLGQAETVGAGAELFTLVDKRHKIYRKRPADYAAHMPVGAYPLNRPTLQVASATGGGAAEARVIQNEANRVLLDRYSPAGVLVNEDMEIVQFRGHTGPYLEPAPGDASLNLLKLAREGLLHGLRSALQAARKTRKPFRKEGLRVRSDGGWSEVALEVIPLTGPAALHFLVLFDRSGTASGKASSARGRTAAGGERNRTARLEEELAATREYLQSIIQEVEAANEELQSANEEILSSNEELQSTNEELDTAKEELQSTNEELNTLNEEMHARNEELTHVNSDLVNLLGSVQIAIVIVSSDLRVRRFTPMAEKLFNLIPADIGRPISQVKPNVDCPDLDELIGAVVDHVSPVEREVRDQAGRPFVLRVRPYKGAENRIEGAVLALFDIDPVKRQERAEEAARRHVESVMEVIGQPLMIVNAAQEVRAMNRTFREAFGVQAVDGHPRRLGDLGGSWSSGPVVQWLDRLFSDGGAEGSMRITVDGPDGHPRAFMLHGHAVAGLGNDDKMVLVAVEEVSGSTG